MKRIISILTALVMTASLLCTAVFADEGGELTSAEGWTIITVDAGHGGNGGGYCRINGREYCETEIVLKIAYYLKEELETYQKVKVVLTRTTNSQEEYDRIYELGTRGQIAADCGSDVFISLHINGTDYRNSASGACILVPNGNYRPELVEKDYELGRCILARLNELGIGTYHGGFLTRDSEENPPDQNPDGTVADYYGIVRTGLWHNLVTVLVEHCFIDNTYEATNYLSTDEQLKALAHADAMGIVDYLGLQKASDEEPSDNEYCLLDYRGFWAHEAIDKAVLAGWVKGYGDHTFRPRNSVTRGEFVTFLGRAAGVDTGLYCESAFADVPTDKFCASYVQWAAENGIVNGYEDGNFYPDRNITREQIAKIMTCFLAYMGYDVSGEYSLEDFQIGDVDAFSSWAGEYVAFCYANGLLQGNNGCFEPKRTATRGEACAVLVRMMEFGQI